MTTGTDRIPTLRRTAASAPGAATVLLLHGFLDDATVWDDVVAALGDQVATVRYDLPGFGSRAAESAATVSLSALADEAAGVLDGIDGPVIVVGQSLGSQIAELLAAGRPGRVSALVLLTPVPLTGTHLSEEAIAGLRGLGGDPAGQRAARSQLSPALTTAQLDRLTDLGAPVHHQTAARYVDVFNDGVDAPATSTYPGPVWVISGGADGFVTAPVLAAVTARFPHARSEVIDGAGHWLHVEAPTPVAAAILTAAGDPSGGWRQGFAQVSEAAFADAFADQVVLEATALRIPIHGRQDVATVMAAASAIYETLEFTAEATNGPTTYLQWHATAFGAAPIDGVTVLRRDPDGRITFAAVHHRPLPMVLRFSAELRDRLAGVIAAEHFVEPGD